MRPQIRLNKTQGKFFTDKTKFSYYTGGYKAGKTFILCHKAVKILMETQEKGLIAEPTYRMNEDLLRPELEKALKFNNIQFKWVDSDSLYRTAYGDILLRTQDKRSSLEGHNIAWFAMDEMDLLPKSKCHENWRVLISKLTKGEVQYGFGVGTNEGYEFIYEKFFKEALPSEAENIYRKPDHALFVASTLENQRNLPKGYIESLYQNYDEKLIARYIRGEFVNIKSGRVYYKFTDKNKIKMSFDPNRPIIMSWDVNYSDRPMSTVFIQKFNKSEIPYAPDYLDNEVYIVTKSFINPNTNSQVQCQIIDEFLSKYNYNIGFKVYGDRVGNDRRVGAPLSHYEIVEQYFSKYGIKILTRPTLSIVDRITSLNSLFENAEGKVRLLIDIDNVALIDDLEQVIWKENKNELDNSDINRTDPSDALSYWSYYEFDITNRVPKWN